MLFHVPSFVVGYASGVASTALARQLKPLLIEVATAGYRLFDAMAVRVVRKREDLEDMLAEARARARQGFEGGRVS